MTTETQNDIVTPKQILNKNNTIEYNKWHLPDGATARLGKGEVNDIRFSPDGTLLAVATSIGIWLYDVDSGKEIAMLPQPKKVNVLAFSPDGKTLAGGEFEYQFYDSAVRLWDVETCNIYSSFTGNWKEIKSLSYTTDGKNLIIAGSSIDWSEEIWIWNPTEDTHLERVVDLSHIKGYPGSTLSLSPDGHFLASVVKPNDNQNCKIKIWDVNTGQQISTLHDSTVRSVSMITFSTDGNTVATTDTDNIQFWDVEIGKLSFSISTSTYVHTLAFSPDDNHLASGSRDGFVRLWKVPTDGSTSILRRVWSKIIGMHPKTYLGHADTFKFRAITISQDNKMVASANTDGTVRGWDLESETEICSHTQHLGEIKTFAFYKSDKKLTSISLNLGKMMATVWDTDTGRELSTEIIDDGKAGNSTVILSPDGSLFATEEANESIRLWDGITKRFMSLLKGKYTHKQKRVFFMRHLVFSPDNKLLARGDRDGTIQIWDVEYRHALPTLEGHTGNFHRILFAPDSKTLASTNVDATTRLWDVSTNTELAKFEGEQRRSLALAFSPDGKIFANGVNIFRFDETNGEYEHIYRLQNVKYNIIKGLTFSPDARFLIASGFGKIDMWDTSTGEHLSMFNAHTGWIDEIVFSPDGTVLASRCEYDGTILLWDWKKIISKI